MKNDEVKLAPKIGSFTLSDPIEHPQGLQRLWSDSSTNITYHDSLSEFETEQESRINARINTANDHGPQSRHQGYILREMMRSEVLVTFY
jgi:hypothetical protein